MYRLCCVQVDYLLLAHGNTPYVRVAPRNLYFDMGASLWQDLSQSWMLEKYDARGIHFDRHLMWE